MGLNKKQLLLGVATYLPGVKRFYSKRTGGSVSARYCYSVWMRHLVLALRNGLPDIPKTVAELGPGESLGMGLAALISGAERYYAFDIIKLAGIEKNLATFEELVDLFRNRERIPDDKEFPRIKPFLDYYDFPRDIFSDDVLRVLLDERRIQFLRDSIRQPDHKNPVIQYVVPWHKSNRIKPEAVDMIFSQAVLEHIDDLEETYKALFSWLRSGGVTTHQIDFKCHGLTHRWNGHWGVSARIWKLIRGRRPYLINREPCGTHMRFFDNYGFSIEYLKRMKADSGIMRGELSKEFRSISDEDLLTSGVFVIAKK